MSCHSSSIVLVAVFLNLAASCDVRVRISSGPLCGKLVSLPDTPTYARFLGVPYAKQPVGDLRFRDLQAAEVWTEDFNATTEGPVCPQTDLIYGKLMQPQGMSEQCIHANVHVPKDALRASDQVTVGVPILVFIHGGGFLCGSGDRDVYDPQYLYSKKVIIVTFNYRLDLFGFLTLNSSTVPGNAGLRDMITLLKWVQTNAQAFGGDPTNVTLMGQSAGGTSAHLLSLSPAAKGLFHRLILLSGNAFSDFYTTTPAYSSFVTNAFLTKLGISSTDPNEIHQQLVEMPLATLMEVNAALQNETGIVAFVPVVESTFDGVTKVIDDYPENLVKNGRGKDIPMIVSFTTAECYSFQSRINDLQLFTKSAADSTIFVPSRFLFTLPNETIVEIGQRMAEKYYNGTVTVNKYIDSCGNTNFVYPSWKLAQLRLQTGAAATYMQQFSYEGEYRVIPTAFALNYTGVGHLEDLSYVLRVSSMFNESVIYDTPNDDLMVEWMTTFVYNFMTCGSPTCNESSDSDWPPLEVGTLKYQDLRNPQVYSYMGLTAEQNDILEFYKSIDEYAGTSS